MYLTDPVVKDTEGGGRGRKGGGGGEKEMYIHTSVTAMTNNNIIMLDIKFIIYNSYAYLSLSLNPSLHMICSSQKQHKKPKAKQTPNNIGTKKPSCTYATHMSHTRPEHLFRPSSSANTLHYTGHGTDSPTAITHYTLLY